MATARNTTTSSKAAPASRRRPKDAIAMLKADHKKVNALFDDYESARSPRRKQSIVEAICQELAVHALIEEEIFYPAVKKALKDKELVPEAIVEHATLKEFIAKVRGKVPDGEMFDAHIQVM